MELCRLRPATASEHICLPPPSHARMSRVTPRVAAPRTFARCTSAVQSNLNTTADRMRDCIEAVQASPVHRPMAPRPILKARMQEKGRPRPQYLWPAADSSHSPTQRGMKQSAQSSLLVRRVYDQWSSYVLCVPNTLCFCCCCASLRALKPQGQVWSHLVGSPMQLIQLMWHMCQFEDRLGCLHLEKTQACLLPSRLFSVPWRT